MNWIQCLNLHMHKHTPYSRVVWRWLYFSPRSTRSCPDIEGDSSGWCAEVSGGHEMTARENLPLGTLAQLGPLAWCDIDWVVWECHTFFPPPLPLLLLLSLCYASCVAEVCQSRDLESPRSVSAGRLRRLPGLNREGVVTDARSAFDECMEWRKCSNNIL